MRTMCSLFFMVLEQRHTDPSKANADCRRKEKKDVAILVSVSNLSQWQRHTNFTCAYQECGICVTLF